MSRHRRWRHGEGTAWLIADQVHHDYLCYWYAGTSDGHVAEQARAASAAEAVAWGRLRTPRVRIRTAEARTYWAGIGPQPAAYAATWSDPDAIDIGHGSSRQDGVGARQLESQAA